MEPASDPSALVSLVTPGLKATVSAQGAQLVRLQDETGRDFLWDANPAIWGWHAPLLFPIIGRARGDQIDVDGTLYPIRQHGFARTSRFERVAADASACTFRLAASPETRRHYPFVFVLDVTYRVSGRQLAIKATVRNTDDQPLPVSFGFHPAFRWPLPDGGAKEAHEITFTQDEPEPLRQLSDGLLIAAPRPTPVNGRTLVLKEALFSNDALIFDQVRSRGVVYRGPHGPAITVTFPDMPQLGIWSKLGADFVCIEPWHGHADLAEVAVPFRAKEDSVTIAPGAERAFAITIAIAPA